MYLHDLIVIIHQGQKTVEFLFRVIQIDGAVALLTVMTVVQTQYLAISVQ
ncbi:MAG: hypothetical protein WD491_10575 [Balneolales bacterium]